MTETFKGSFTQQEPIPDEGIAAALRVMKTGRLHRYNTAQGEVSETVMLEQEFAASVGAKYCLAVASGGYAIATALRACGVGPGDPVLTNAFTLAPVPGAIAGVGGVPIFVGVTEELVIDLDDLRGKLDRARVLLLSHMRGHICDMDALMALCDAAGVAVVEDCAHTMGASWNGTPSGRFGRFGCFSTQTYKHINSGEGGLLIGENADDMARATMLSGSYMLFGTHGAGPAAAAYETLRYETPNISGRMDNLRAAILRPQLKDLAQQAQRWNGRYNVVEDGLRDVAGLSLIPRPAKESFVASSFQFLLLDWPADAITDVQARCAARGVELKWFGGAEPVGFTSRYDSWRYAAFEPMPSSDRVLAGIMDMRLPLTFSLEDCAFVAEIIRAEVSAVWQAHAADAVPNA